MHRRIVFSRICFCFIACVLLLSAAPLAASEKERMLARIPALNELKDQGLVGENNLGRLEYRTKEMPHKDVMDAENSDRMKVYKAIAKKQGTTADLVGKRRALQIAEKAKVGEWLQKPDGAWYTKP